MLVRYFAGAAAAAGKDQQELEVSSGQTLGHALEQLGAATPGLSRIFEVAILLADGVRVTDRSQGAQQIRQLDVLPPFAGG